MMTFLRDRILPRLPVGRYRDAPPLVAVVRLSGVIAAPGGLMRAGLNLQSVAGVLERAFKLPRLRAVALAINSPGGSPVQSALIARRIRSLAIEHSVPVFAFCEDVAASGGYWLACAADEIYADAASVVGSIGVVSAGFGLDEFIRRHGIERRIYTAGTSKAILDPFQPEKREDVERLQALQRDIHAQFIQHVKQRR
ncbi:MAG TPA: S49 family peptidase, partial [Alphaproteobacteria bacterium]|nr:S49 family peptidase [Alphaproteobacteria bacterium]